MLRINVDVDNTINNFLESFLELFNSISGRNVQYADIKEYSLEDSLGIPNRTLQLLFFKNNAFYKTLTPLFSSGYVIEKLVRCGHDVMFVTAIDYDVVQSRIEFLKKHFPFMDVNKSLIVTSDKCSIPADIVIDDNPEHLQDNPGCSTYIKYFQPWNKDYTNKNVIPCRDWQEIDLYFIHSGVYNK